MTVYHHNRKYFVMILCSDKSDNNYKITHKMRHQGLCNIPGKGSYLNSLF